MSRSRSKYKRKSGLKPKLAPIKPNWPTKGVKTLTPKRDKKSKNKKINQPAKLPPTETNSVQPLYEDAASRSFWSLGVSRGDFNAR